MNYKIFLCLFALSLQIGCGGGNGTSGGGTGNTVYIDGLLLEAHITPPDGSISIDVFHSPCGTDGGQEEPLHTAASTFTVEVTNVAHTTGSLHPVGVTFSDYVVSWVKRTPRSPDLRTRSPREANAPPLLQNIPLRSSASAEITGVIIAAVDEEMPEVREYWGEEAMRLNILVSEEGALTVPDGVEDFDFVSSHNVTVTMRGRTFSGKNFTISARQYIEIGEFNRCDA